jgi:hypothetical protein
MVIGRRRERYSDAVSGGPKDQMTVGPISPRVNSPKSEEQWLENLEAGRGGYGSKSAKYLGERPVLKLGHVWLLKG